MTEKGKARIALSQARMERRHAAAVAEEQRADLGKEEEKAADANGPPTNLRS